MDNVQDAILDRIRSSEHGNTCISKDFRGLGTRDAVDKVNYIIVTHTATAPASARCPSQSSR